ncbi:Rad4-domain-containing protein [Xylona heveae TC161]|uniref:Rad4-domain-containing protein n=1 Tax=Xylona heveae (strain CBS 132557 / TC161) TaxID=1328760 RepID=A0A165FIF6_XYLHT|nr:Rad4-domain-containing protein [Xylona heveae TC161]KZF21012.1 Rad4-domain-containing protein [Xylona heveae TC161]
MPPRSRGNYPNRRAGRNGFAKLHSRISPAPEEVHEIISLDEESDNSVVVTGSRVKPTQPQERRRAPRTTKPASSPPKNDAMPNVYLEMLHDASALSQHEPSDRASKRRRVESRLGAESLDYEPQHDVISVPEDSPGHTTRPPPQIIFDDDESSEESDFDWEEVDLARDTAAETPSAAEEGPSKGLDIVIGGERSGPERKVARRRPVTAYEKKARLDIHKTHLLCLVAHACMRSTWCNDDEVQSSLQVLLSKKTQSYLVPNATLSQFQRSRSFMDGLAQASEIWRNKFNITARGLRNAVWAENEETLKNYKLPEDTDTPMDLSDFRSAAKRLQGSRDIGAQLFCALLRSVGVTARLVCSLQPLPFSSSKSATAQPSTPNYIYADTGSSDSSGEDDHGIDLNGPSPAFGASSTAQGVGGAPVLPPRIRRIGQPFFGEPRRMDIGKPPPAPQPRKKFRESPFPVYWVEVFNEALQKWIPVDPLVTKTIAKPSKFEPPASDIENTMSYVVGLEAEGEVKDVTRRYAKAYNGKTRKLRVESTKGGDRWWWKALRKLRRGWVLDRDQVEDGELAAREASEEMPRNVQDFKDHPYYALERHLKRNEVIFPKREVGKMSVGRTSSTGPGKALEPIYRRRDVNIVKSADGWYRLGREIKAGEQPLKFVTARRNQVQSFEDDDDRTAQDAGVGLYAEFQTTLYEPPPIVNGRVPKNAFGNLDVYVPTMVPKGGFHIADSEAARAASIVGVDYADAVTGFEFRGRQGTAVVRGIIAPAEYQEAIEAVIQGLRDEQAAAEEALRSAEAVRMWKRFLVALRIKERISGYDIEGMQEEEDRRDLEDEQDDAEAEGGGFFMDRDQVEIAEPTAPPFNEQLHMTGPLLQSGHDDNADKGSAKITLTLGEDFPGSYTTQPAVESEYAAGGGFFAEDDGGGGGFLFEENLPADAAHSAVSEGSGGGFVPQGEGVNNSLDYHEANPKPGDANIYEPQNNSHLLAEGSTNEAEPVGEESDELEKGSLLSHDPEDEDAEPEWLIDD